MNREKRKKENIPHLQHQGIRPLCVQILCNIPLHISDMSEERHRPGTAMYIRDGQILRSDAAREAKAIKDAEDVVREVLDDPEYQLSRERSSQGYSQNEDEKEGLTENELKIIIKKEGSKESVTKGIVKDKNDLEEEKQKGMCAECTAGGSISKKSTVQKEGISQAKETKDTVKAKKSVVRAKEKTDKARINLSDQSTRERMKYTHGKEAQNDVKNESSSDESVTKPGKSQHIVVRSKEVSTSNAVNLHNVRAEVMNQPYQRANSKWEKDQRNPEVVGVQEAYTAKAEVSHSQGEAKALNAQVKGRHLTGCSFYILMLLWRQVLCTSSSSTKGDFSY